MNDKLVWLIIVCICATLGVQATTVTHLRVAYQFNPTDIVAKHPLLSWELNSTARNVQQVAYRVLVANSREQLQQNQGNVWDSGRIPSQRSIQVRYEGTALQATQAYYWKVKIWDNHGYESTWSEVAYWQMGLITKQDWKGAQWIAYEDIPQAQRDPLPKSDKKDRYFTNNVLPLLRKSFGINRPIAQATLFISGLGHFELHVNGNKVGDHFLDAGWTKYDKEALYETFDVSQQLQKGENVIGVMLGNGFYYIPPVRGRYRKQKGAFGYPKMICRLHVVYTDGTTEDVVSNDTWKTDKSPIIFSSIYGGEDYDARLEQAGWDYRGFNDSKWRQALVVTGPPILSPQLAEPLKIFDHFEDRLPRRATNGNWIYDLGQNASGIIELQVRGHRGDTVRIYPGELLKDGAVTQKASGSPFYFTYVLKGEDLETWRPRFTYYGFRYLEVRGAVPESIDKPGMPQIVTLKGLHTRNAAPRIGSFQCSSTLFNRTYTLIDWAIKSNMASVLTDCPHREKLGWLEQTHLMGASVQYNYQVATLFRKAVHDMMLSQLPNGLVPEIAPEYVEFNWGGEMFRDSPEWGSACIILPWYLYKWYGDREILQIAYPMMQKYIGYLQSKAVNHLLKQGLGDWYDLGPKPPGISQLTPMGLTGTAIYYYDLQLMKQIADVLGMKKNQMQYGGWAEQVKQAFNQAFFNKETKQYASGSQTANAMALYMDLVEPPYQATVLQHLIDDIQKQGNRLTAGDIGYRYVLRVLEQEGRSDIIYDMNSHADVPGYGYQLAKGATALTESWQALPTVSNNHLMLGHLMEWFYSGLAGIRQQREGHAFHRLEIRPQIVGNMTSTVATYHTPYGEVESSWKKDGSQLELVLQIPANTTAKVYIPCAESEAVLESNQSLEAAGITILDREEDHVIVAIGSGDYRFLVK